MVADSRQTEEQPQRKEPQPEPSNADLMATLARLDVMMTNMVVKTDLEVLRRDMRQETKVTVAASVDPLKSDLHDFKVRVKELEETCAAPAFQNAVKKDDVQAMIKESMDQQEHRIKSIEAAISELKISPVSGGKDQSTAVVGGLGSASSADAAKAWLKDLMAKVGVQGVADVYDKCNGAPFNGMVFVKFSSEERREAAMSTFNNAKSSFNTSRTFMSPERPILERTKFSFLLNFKRLLIDWGFKNVSFDDGIGTISVARTPVLKVSTEGSTFKSDWLEDTWGQWALLTDDVQYKALIQTAEDKLKKASLSKGKGKDSSA